MATVVTRNPIAAHPSRPGAARVPFSEPNHGLTVGPPAAGGLDAAAKASARWHVPVEILWGIYGIETDFGKNVHTSSAGANGPMQFMPGTWATYGHGRDINDTYAAMDAAAEKLWHDSNQGRDWAAAIRAYGGGYTLDDVKKKAASSSTQPGDIPVVGPAVDAAAGVAKTVGDLVSALLDPHTWIRLFEAVGGAVLILMALRELTGGSVDPIGAARRALP